MGDSCRCWTDKAAWLDDNGALPIDVVQCQIEGNATCLLPDGHDGPHEWTPDSEITVRFIG